MLNQIEDIFKEPKYIYQCLLLSPLMFYNIHRGFHLSLHETPLHLLISIPIELIPFLFLYQKKKKGFPFFTSVAFTQK